MCTLLLVCVSVRVFMCVATCAAFHVSVWLHSRAANWQTENDANSFHFISLRFFGPDVFPNNSTATSTAKLTETPTATFATQR